ncbi:unnamed protein product [Nippostrongylus brasiliensis]|uniref:Secreted protein n=1 Tax=Nippostrongylus brasiliensis TaxID=27835 RepID=A0A0N4YXD0_NIPBR|nr:unnamed protein product [Nippostrongylus brasiliensis]
MLIAVSVERSFRGASSSRNLNFKEAATLKPNLLSSFILLCWIVATAEDVHQRVAVPVRIPSDNKYCLLTVVYHFFIQYRVF